MALGNPAGHRTIPLVVILALGLLAISPVLLKGVEGVSVASERQPMMTPTKHSCLDVYNMMNFRTFENEQNAILSGVNDPRDFPAQLARNWIEGQIANLSSTEAKADRINQIIQEAEAGQRGECQEARGDESLLKQMAIQGEAIIEGLGK